MKVGPNVMTPMRHAGHSHEVIPRVGNSQAGGNLKLIQCQLMLLLHARRCQQRHELMQTRNEPLAESRVEKEGNAITGPEVANSMARALLLNCPIRHCGAMKQVLSHMKMCRLGATCTYQHCTTSLRILSHWANCTIHDCPLCMLVRMRMARAKEWESTLPRSSRYTLLAAALRSSQGPEPTPPNCQIAEQAQEGQSGVPCQEKLDDIRKHRHRQVVNSGNDNVQDDQSQENAKDKSGREPFATCESIPGFAGPSPDQVRKAYEQLGIPCPEQALQRLMATLPLRGGSSQNSSKEGASGNDEPEDLTTDDNSMDVSCEHDDDSRSSNADPGIFDCYHTYSSPTVPAPALQQQHELISSTTSSTTPQRLPFNSSR